MKLTYDYKEAWKINQPITTAKMMHLSSWEKPTSAQKIESYYLLMIYNEI